MLTGASTVSSQGELFLLLEGQDPIKRRYPWDTNKVSVKFTVLITIMSGCKDQDYQN